MALNSLFRADVRSCAVKQLLTHSLITVGWSTVKLQNTAANSQA